MGIHSLHSQIVLSSPVTQQGQEISDPYNIRVLPGFKANSATIGTFRAFIGNTNNNSNNQTDYNGSGTSSENYITTRIYLDATTNSSPSVRQLYTIKYFDGLGRPKQEVNVKATPQGKDIITHIEYDQVGRQSKNYLPIPQTGSQNGNIYTSPLANASSIYGGEKIFSEAQFENSPLNRAQQLVQAGTDWSGKPIKFNYDVNTPGDNLKKYSTVTAWDQVGKMTISSIQPPEFYLPNTLYKNTITDEDGNKTIKFKNAKNQLVLSRKVSENNENTDTYYVYNEYDQLAFVIPPLISTWDILKQSTLDNLCYQYRYDNQGRLVEKKLPGKDWEHMVYDKADRLILTQTGNLRKQNKWLITKYDQLGRVAYTGFLNGGERATRQNEINKLNIVESRSTTGFTRNGITVYYTDNYFIGEIPTLLKVNYYDTYPQGYNFTPSFPTSIQNQNVLKDNLAAGTNTKGFPVMELVKNIEDDNWTKDYTYYDTSGKVIGTHSINHLGGYTKTESKLSFTGVPQTVLTRHKRLSSDTEQIITQTFEYDAQNRLKKQWHQVGSNPIELLADNTYNELSQLSNKKVGNNLQNIDYAYNIHGSLVKINDPENLNGKLFTYAIKYQNPSNASTTKKFNSNITEVDWRTAQDGVLKRYNYQYDAQNRITKGIYSEPGSTLEQNGYFNEELSYDLNGNINTLKRYTKPSIGTTAELIDNLQYNYENSNLSNRLERITVADGSPDNPSGYLVLGNKILYDDDGNMIEMKDKGRSRIDYNYLNLPNFFDGDGFDYAKYVYSANGEKVKKTEWFAFGNKTAETDYLDNFQYVNGSLKFVPTSEGYYNYENGKYVYNYSDHLGNTRLSYTKKTGSTDIEILSENSYYPFGLKHFGFSNDYLNKNPNYRYEYNDKEYQYLAGSMYDYGARFYMPDLGRWGVTDPLSELQYGYSPYSYVYGNPIRFNDPTGMIGNDPPTRGFTADNPVDVGEIFLTPKSFEFSLSSVGIYGVNNYDHPASMMPSNCLVCHSGSGLAYNIPQTDPLAYRGPENGQGGGLQSVSILSIPYMLLEAGLTEALMQLGIEGEDAYTAAKTATFLYSMKAPQSSNGTLGVVNGNSGSRILSSYTKTSTAIRSALANRTGKRGFSEVGYQFQKHHGRGGNWTIPQGVKQNPTMFNQAGYKTFKEIWRAPGSFKNVGGFYEKRLSDGRGIRLQHNWQFKGFLD